MNTTELSPCPFCKSDGEELGICADLDMPESSARRIQCYGCNVETPFHPSEADAIAAWNTRASPAPGRAPLTEADMEDLKRLREVFDDGQGYDVPKERMKRLAELGVVRWHGRDVYSITAFGMYCLGDWEFPLRTAEEINAELHAEMLARNGIAPAGGIGGEKP